MRRVLRRTVVSAALTADFIIAPSRSSPDARAPVLSGQSVFRPAARGIPAWIVAVETKRSIGCASPARFSQTLLAVPSRTGLRKALRQFRQQGAAGLSHPEAAGPFCAR